MKKFEEYYLIKDWLESNGYEPTRANIDILLEAGFIDNLKRSGRRAVLPLALAAGLGSTGCVGDDCPVPQADDRPAQVASDTQMQQGVRREGNTLISTSYQPGSQMNTAISRMAAANARSQLAQHLNTNRLPGGIEEKVRYSPEHRGWVAELRMDASSVPQGASAQGVSAPQGRPQVGSTRTIDANVRPLSGGFVTSPGDL